MGGAHLHTCAKPVCLMHSSEVLIFTYSATPHLGTSLPLFHVLSHQPRSGLNCEIVELRDERRDGSGTSTGLHSSCSGHTQLRNNIRHRNPRPGQTTKMIPWTFQFCLNKLCSCEARIYNLQSTWDVRCATAELKSSCQLGKPQIKKEKYKDRISWQAGPGRHRGECVTLGCLWAFQ